MFTFGLDIGNGAVKLVGPDPGDRLLIPHATAACPPGFTRDTTLVPADEDPIAHLHVRIRRAGGGTSEILAGDVVLREYPLMAEEARMGEEKSLSARHAHLAVTALAAAAARHDPLASTVVAGVATGLPAAEFRRPGAREAMARALAGRHAVTFVTSPNPRWAGRTVEIDVRHADVLPEGAPAFLVLAQQDPELARGTVLVVDVGVRSVEWALFRAGKYQPGMSGGRLDGGLAAAADRILEAVHRIHGPRFGRHRGDVLAALLRAHRDGGPVVMAGMGRRVDVTDTARAELARTAAEVADAVVQAAASAGDADAIYVVGGAGEILFPHLKEAADVPVRLAPDPMWANAAGLWRRAKALADSGRWT